MPATPTSEEGGDARSRPKYVRPWVNVGVTLSIELRRPMTPAGVMKLEELCAQPVPGSATKEQEKRWFPSWTERKS